jgi:DNA-binding IclR family transcriptional regulator
MARSTVKSAERALEVLLFLSSVPTPVPAAVIGRNVGLPKSSMYHLLNVMLDRGFVSHLSEEGTWGIGPAACDVGSAIPKHEGMIRLARPLMRRLTSATDATCLLGVLYGGDVLVVERTDPGIGAADRAPRTGERFPAHASALGRALLMEQPVGALDTLFPFPDLPVIALNGPRNHADLVEVLARSRARGFAAEHGEQLAGMDAIAAPVFDHLGFVGGAIGIMFEARPGRPSQLNGVPNAVRRAAAGLSARLGHRAQGSAS